MKNRYLQIALVFSFSFLFIFNETGDALPRKAREIKKQLRKAYTKALHEDENFRNVPTDL